MRALDLVPCQPRPYRPTTTRQGQAAPAPDLVNRDFTADAPGDKLVGDITYIPTAEGFLYLATAIDCYTKECAGYAMADHMRASLVIDALSMADRNARLNDGAIFHTDRGSQYTASTPVRPSPCTPKASGSVGPWAALGSVSIMQPLSHSMLP